MWLINLIWCPSRVATAYSKWRVVGIACSGHCKGGTYDTRLSRLSTNRVHVVMLRRMVAKLRANLCLIQKCGWRCNDGVTHLRRLRRYTEAKLSSVLHHRAPPTFFYQCGGLHIQLKSEVYIHLSQIHLNSVFHNSWHLILVKIPCLRSVRITTLF